MGHWLIAGMLPEYARARPRMKQVLPAPRAPTSATTLPGRRRAASVSPARSVSSGLALWSSVAGGILLHLPDRGWDRLDHVARDEPLLSLLPSSEVAGEAVQVGRGAERPERLQAAREEGADQAREDVAGAAAGHAGIPGRVEKGRAGGGTEYGHSA